MHYLYILYSDSSDKYYVGETTNLEVRLIKHNTHVYKKSFTKIAVDWRIVLKKEYNDRKEVLFLERFIKKMKSRKFIDKIIEDPKILEDILNKR